MLPRLRGAALLLLLVRLGLVLVAAAAATGSSMAPAGHHHHQGRLQTRKKEDGEAAAATAMARLPSLRRSTLTAPTAAGHCSSFLARRGGRGGGPFSFEETEVDRARCLAQGWVAAACLQAIIAAAALKLHVPAALRPFLLEKGNAGLVKGFGAGAVVNLLLVALMGSFSWVRRVPLNVVLIGGIVAVKALLAAALAERFGPAIQRPLVLLTGQGAITMAVLALLASRNMGEGLLPYLAAAVCCLLPARGVAMLLGWPIRQVMTGEAGAFLVSLLFVFVSQNAVRGKGAHRGGLESLADVYVDVSRSVWRSIFPIKAEDGMMMGSSRGRGLRR